MVKLWLPLAPGCPPLPLGYVLLNLLFSLNLLQVFVTFFFSLHNNNKSTGTYFSTISQGGQQVEWTFLKNGSKTKKDQIIFPRVFLTWTVILVIYEKDF